MEKKYRRRAWLTIILLACVYIGDIVLRCHGLLALPCVVLLNIALCTQLAKLNEYKIKSKEEREIDYPSIVSDISEISQDDDNKDIETKE